MATLDLIPTTRVVLAGNVDVDDDSEASVPTTTLTTAPEEWPRWDEGIPPMRDIGVKLDDPFQTPPPRFYLPLTLRHVEPEDDDDDDDACSLPLLPTLNTPPNGSSIATTLTCPLAPRGEAPHFSWPLAPQRPHATDVDVLPKSPRDVVTESHSAWRGVHDGKKGKKTEEKDWKDDEPRCDPYYNYNNTHRDNNNYKDANTNSIDELRRLFRATPLNDNDDDEGCWIEEAPSDASSLSSSSPWVLESNAAAIFRLARTSRTMSDDTASSRCDNKALQLWIRSAPPLCISTSDSASSCSDDSLPRYRTSLPLDDEEDFAEMENRYHPPHPHNSTVYPSQTLPASADTKQLPQSSAARGRQLKEAWDILLEVITPECCGLHRQGPLQRRPGVLQPWHALPWSNPPRITASPSNSSSHRLRGNYL